ncbi:MAG: hypothetical protein ABI886_05640 [Betaproteobacteria bacterium]
MRHQSLLAYAKYRYLKVAAAVVAVTVAAYALHRPPAGPYGGTWLGYVLGTVGALMILWLLWFGVRKRRYSSTAGTLLGWLSAHVYLGTTLLVIATLHAAFQVGWNVHTLAYVLMVLVILSGFYGVWVYLKLPAAITDTLAEDTLESLLIKIADLDRQARPLALSLPDACNRLVLAASLGTDIGGSWRTQIAGRDPDCPTIAAVVGLQAIGKTLRGEQARANQQLYAVMVRKQELVARARRAVALKARIDVWLFVHVPLSVALLAALAAHVVSVFFYW